jgi:ribosomal protein L35AE/L33A
MFVEIFLKSHAYDNRVGIDKYEPVQSDDNGVDGIGLNIAGEQCAVQVKFRSNASTLLTADGDHLANLISDGLLKYGIQQSKDKEPPRHYIITTAKGLHRYTETEFFKSKVICYGYDDLRNLLDGNKSFWNLCREIAENEANKKKDT